MQGELAAQAESGTSAAPESRDVVTIAPEYGLFIGGEFVPAAGGRQFPTVNPATEEPLAQVADAGQADVDRAVAAARTAYERVWGPMPGAERAKYLYRIARLLQERSREVAVLESLDNGKPIKESRDVDIPLAAAHFLYHAGWADKLEHAGFGPSPRPLGVTGQVIPWNFPLLMAAWKPAPALTARQHLRAQAHRDHPADRAAARRGLPAGRTPARSLERDDRCRVNWSRAGVASGRRQGRVHRLDRGRQGNPARGGGHRQAADAGARRQGSERRVRRRAGRAGDRGDRERHLLQPGSRLLRRTRLLVQESVADAVVGGSAQARHAAARRPAGQEHRHRRDQLTRAAGQDQRAVRRGEAESSALDPALRPARAGLLVPADGVHRVRQSHRIAAKRSSGRCCPCSRSDPGRGGRQGEQHPVWPVRRGLDREGQPDPVDGAAAAGHVVWANTYNRFDPASPFGG